MIITIVGLLMARAVALALVPHAHLSPFCARLARARAVVCMADLDPKRFGVDPRPAERGDAGGAEIPPCTSKSRAGQTATIREPPAGVPAAALTRVRDGCGGGLESMRTTAHLRVASPWMGW